MIDHVAAIDPATPLPVSVDLENGYGEDPADAARAVAVAALAEAAGLIRDQGSFGGIRRPPAELNDWLE